MLDSKKSIAILDTPLGVLMRVSFMPVSDCLHRRSVGAPQITISQKEKSSILISLSNYMAQANNGRVKHINDH